MAFKVRATIGERAAAGARASGNGHRKNGSRGGGGNGDQPRDDSGGDSRRRDSATHFSPVAYRVGLAAVMAAVMMTFGALTIVYLFRAGGANWYPINIPRALWLSTALLILSSLAFEIARRAMRQGAEAKFRRWMTATVWLGAAFLAVQLVAWVELRAQGVYLAGNPHSSFFYLLTGVHALHLLGGIAGAIYLLFRLRRFGARAGAIARDVRGEALMSVGALYWHSMDALWVYIFALLFLWG